MHKIIITLLLIAYASLAHGLDLGGLMDKTSQGGNTSDLLNLAAGTPLEEERAIGKEIAGRLLGASPLVKDDKLQSYVNKVGAWVALQGGRDELEWHFGVIETEDINAFAAPGGYIFITKGLYRTLKNEAELAGVLAHEVGHVTKKHHLNILKKSKAIGMGKDLISSRIGGGAGEEAIKNLLGSGAEIMARGLDKDAEYEADRIGVVLATRAGYDSFGLPSVLQEIGHGGASASSVQLLFKTHPHPDARLAQLGNAMGDRFDQYDGLKKLPERLCPLKD